MINPTTLVAIVGPTGTGKSDLALDLASTLINRGQPAEIINCDSMQFYRGMDIGTAKLKLEQRRGIEHHMLDYLKVTQESTAAEYQRLVRPLIEQLQADGITPILVGGSMLYVAAVINDFEFPGTDQDLRAELESQLAELGSVALHAKLAELDPTAASRVDPLNPRRVVRALEIVQLTGKPFAAVLPDEPKPWKPSIQIGLKAQRSELVVRLEKRVQEMWRQGLVEEVHQLIGEGLREARTAGRAIGYAQALGQIDGLISEAEAIASTAQLTQKYARRQMSWLNRDKRINWFDYDNPKLLTQALATLEA